MDHRSDSLRSCAREVRAGKSRFDGLVRLGSVAVLGLTLSGLLWTLTPHPRGYRVAVTGQPGLELDTVRAEPSYAYAFQAGVETATP